MTNIFLKDSAEIHGELLPISYTRPLSMLQTGILTPIEKWQRLLAANYSIVTEPYLQPVFGSGEASDSPADAITIASHIVPDQRLARAVEALKSGQELRKGDVTIARRGSGDCFEAVEYEGEVDIITKSYHLFQRCGAWIEADYRLITDGRTSQPLSPSCTLIGDSANLFIEEGARVEGAIINVTTGPVYIGRDAEVMEGACLRGPIALLDKAEIHMGARVYSATVIGRHCKVGGEISNVVFHPYSNKAHDGFLGNAVIGSWCNLGAGATASNLKNDYTEIKLWNYPTHRFLRTGLQFCGLIMGDHSKAGINTMFNTATTIGVGVNIHGIGFPRNFVASFSEGSPAAGFSNVPMSKFFQIAARVMSRRGIELTDADIAMYEAIREISDNYK